MQVEASGGGHIGERRGSVEERDQMGALSEVRCRRAGAAEASGLAEKLVREGRAMTRRRAGHEPTPRGMGRRDLSDDIPSIVAAFDSP
jgi:hypothetical protein